MLMFRARFKREILAEFLPPAHAERETGAGIEERARGGSKKERVMKCCAMGCLRFRANSHWRSFCRRTGIGCFIRAIGGHGKVGGAFLERSPHLDILDVIDGLRGEIRELAFGQRFRVRADELFVIGGSFGGAAAILCSLDERVKKVIANCPVVDWGILRESEKAETSNPNYAAYIRAAFGMGLLDCRTGTGRSSTAELSIIPSAMRMK